MKNLSKSLINTSNLHVGGGIQVAASVINELALKAKNLGQVSVLSSTEVDRNLLNHKSKNSQFDNYKIYDTYGFNFFEKSFHAELNKYDVVFTAFGPLYRWRTPFTSIVGFAQAWIIYPKNECYKKISFLSRIKTFIKFWIQGRFFKRADIIVVELEHVKLGLIRELGISPEKIHVIHNCLSSIYTDASNWENVEIPNISCDLRLGFVGRNYPHKNTEIFPAIAKILEENYGLKAKFYVTFTENEWNNCSDQFRKKCINVGPLSVSQCPTFYKAMDAVVFPSLLECFSATPLEAMAMEKPLFASDRLFNRDVCKEHAHYFDPLLPDSAAHAIAKLFKNGSQETSKIRAAREHAIHFSSPKDRAEKYLSLLQKFAHQNQS